MGENPEGITEIFCFSPTTKDGSCKIISKLKLGEKKKKNTQYFYYGLYKEG